MFGFDIASIAKGFGEGILTPIASMFNKKTDAGVEKYKIDGQINVEAMRQDTEIIKARADLAKAMKDDPASKIGKWFFIIPTGVYYTLVVYDSCFRKLIPGYTWVILELPGWMQYMPHAVVAYLLVSAWKK